MKLSLRTRVIAPLPAVWAGFNLSLFERLAPPFPPVRVLRFDGCQTGDVVSLELNFIFFRQRWTSHIIDQRIEPGGSQPAEIYFIDQGVELPFFLRTWHHKHRLIEHGSGTIIADEITYQTPYRLLDYLTYPLLWIQFAYRKPIYKRTFRPLENKNR
jgi:ligand-binding SRPBCC domain-containing protein